MEVTIISLVLLGIQFISLWRDIEKGTIISIVLILVAPNIFSYSYELLGTFLLIVSWLIFKKEEIFKEPILFVDLGYVFVLLLTSVTTVLYAQKFSLGINYAGLFGLVRIFGAIFIYKLFFKTDGVKKLIKILNIVVVINFIVFIVQMTVPSSVKLFYDLYWKPSLTPLEVMLELGEFSRPFGTFGTSVYLSVLLLISTTLYFYLWITQKKSLKWLVYLGMTTLISAFSYSKTTYFGFVIIVVIELILVSVWGRWQHKWMKCTVMFIVAIVGIAVLLKMAETNRTLEYYLSYFKDPLSAFDTRYGEEGNLQDTIQVIKQYPLFGVGISAVQGEFVGDSAYYTALHDSGIVGLAIYICVSLYLLFYALKQKKVIALVLIIVYILIGTAIPIFSNYLGSLVVGIVYGMILEKRRCLYESNAVC